MSRLLNKYIYVSYTHSIYKYICRKDYKVRDTTGTFRVICTKCTDLDWQVKSWSTISKHRLMNFTSVRLISTQHSCFICGLSKSSETWGVFSFWRVIIKSITKVQIYYYKTYVSQFILYDNMNWSEQRKVKNYTDDLLNFDIYTESNVKITYRDRISFDCYLIFYFLFIF